VAIRICALDGGLKDESSTYRVFVGEELGGSLEGILRSTRKVADDEAKSLKDDAYEAFICRRLSMFNCLFSIPLDIKANVGENGS
jgi:hypothetical protein